MIHGGVNGVTVPPADGQRIQAADDFSSPPLAWGSTDGGGNPIGPIYHSSGVHRINARAAAEISAAPPATVIWTSVPTDPNGQQPWSISALLRVVTPIAGKGVLFETTDGPTLQLFLDSAGQMGWSNNGVDTNVAAAVAGVQVLIWTFDPVAGQGKLYRNTGSGLAQVGVTSANVDATGYEVFSSVFIGGSPFSVDPINGMDLAEFWAHPFVFSPAQLAQQAAYLAGHGGL